MKIYTVILEITDNSESDGEDIELWITDVLREGLPDSLEVNVVELRDSDENR